MINVLLEYSVTFPFSYSPFASPLLFLDSSVQNSILTHKYTLLLFDLAPTQHCRTEKVSQYSSKEIDVLLTILLSMDDEGTLSLVAMCPYLIILPDWCQLQEPEKSG